MHLTLFFRYELVAETQQVPHQEYEIGRFGAGFTYSQQSKMQF